MKLLDSKYIIAALFISSLWACKKDEVKVVAKQGTAPSLSANTDTVVLTKQHADDAAVTFKWSASDFGFSGVVKYTLQFAKKGTGFSTFSKVDADSLSKSITVSKLNTIANELEIENGVYTDIEVRVTAFLGENLLQTFSNATTVVVSSYQDLIEYPSMWLPGDYQGWAPATAPKVVSLKSDKQYEGYVYFGGASSFFKVTSLATWDGTNYGGTSDNNAGTLSSTGDNLNVKGAGYYYLNLDFGANSWIATKTNWSVIGDAVGSWDTDVELTYDEAKSVWTGTVLMSAGAFKFRANHSYDINYGDNKPADPLLNKGGDNIAVTEAGTYDVTLNLSVAGNYTYQLKKK